MKKLESVGAVHTHTHTYFLKKEVLKMKSYIYY